MFCVNNRDILQILPIGRGVGTSRVRVFSMIDIHNDITYAEQGVKLRLYEWSAQYIYIYISA